MGLAAKRADYKQPPLRVALIWNGALQAEQILDGERELKLGSGKDALYALPEGVIAEDELTLLKPHAAGYALQPHPALAGFVSVAGQQQDAASLREPRPLGPRDYGVVTLGSVALFFQYVRPQRQALPARLERDFSVLACLGLSLFLHVTVLLFLFLVAAKEFAPAGELELDADLVKRFMVVPPPIDEPLLQRKKVGTETKDPGLRDRDEGGKKQAKSEGRAGKKQASQEDTKLAGEPNEAVAKVRGLGLLGVLSGGSSASGLQSALDTPSLDKMLGGLGAVQTVTGRGSGGLGLRGSGTSGGGTGQGNLFGAGEVGTGIGAGKGGRGRGAGGPGAEGAKAKEAKLSLDNSAAQVKGFLSKEQIDRVVRANQAAIKYCFEAEMQHQPKLEGAVHMNWRIDLQGKVSSVRVAKTTLGNARVEGCMARQIKRWVFPKPDGGEVDVTYPFLLRGG
jgi:hypothetical protein